MHQIQCLALLLITTLLAACSKQPTFTFSVDHTSKASEYANNKYFKEVYHQGNYFHFKGSPTNYYGIDMLNNEVFSGYLIFNGQNPICYSRLNFKGRKTFNRLLNALKKNALLPKDAKPIEELGWIGYSASMLESPSNNTVGIITLRYNTDYGFGHLGIQSGGCLKAFYPNF